MTRPWFPLLLGALVASFAAYVLWPVPGLDPETLAEEAALRRQVATLAAENEAIREQVSIQRDSVAIARRATDSVTVAARAREERRRQDAIRAGQDERDGLGRIRATLEAAGLPTADVDSVEAAGTRQEEARHEEVAAVKEELHAVRWELTQTRSLVERQVTLIESQEARIAAAEGLAATREALWRAAQEEAARIRRDARIWKVVAIVEAGALAWERFGG